MMFTKSALFASAFLLSTSINVQAHNLQNDACDVNINGEIVLANNQATITSKQNDVILLTKSGQASLNGTLLQLNSEQEQTVSSYVDGLEKAIPKAIGLAAKAIEVTNYALTEVFVGILGEDSQLPKVLNKKLTALQQKLESHIYQTPDAVTFNSAFFGGTDQSKSEFEQDIDAAVEEVMGSAMAELFVSIGRSMMSGDGSLQGFEKKMENLGNNIESAITERSQELKDDALDLCDALEKLDEQERKLQQIPELKGIDFLNVSPKRA
ncbi:DUF2884 family protein [Glaciecola sp. SC05]|uniref:DUF2884 family protein n=1 Tax=Glaciecola sp. SC05 TaxID=1987355 RepID=UPI0035275E4E